MYWWYISISRHPNYSDYVRMIPQIILNSESREIKLHCIILISTRDKNKNSCLRIFEEILILSIGEDQLSGGHFKYKIYTIKIKH